MAVLKQLTMATLWTLYASACKAGKTLETFFEDDIDGVYSIKQSSLSSKISNGKTDLMHGASTWEYDGERYTGTELLQLEKNGKRVFENAAAMAKSDETELVKQKDMSKFPTLAGSGRGRSHTPIDHGAVLGSLMGIDEDEDETEDDE